ncbi:hypothetical protein IE81DRAFT_363414 [Ceraceosorus guamensis]|uniref:Uncharacterized protein n=1 Tax=Ceraceosorus guamensis TaxID=1522189 RepID=A0A316W966_9BASI|nr:hypothetical protein IE81DRAFT_363414 [Ceraceosorus guamensis]PWN46439.1 hypothetical protein IE81DRAFT_363414 [Ceraceosorus guamensis]
MTPLTLLIAVVVASATMLTSTLALPSLDKLQARLEAGHGLFPTLLLGGAATVADGLSNAAEIYGSQLRDEWVAEILGEATPTLTTGALSALPFQGEALQNITLSLETIRNLTIDDRELKFNQDDTGSILVSFKPQVYQNLVDALVKNVTINARIKGGNGNAIQVSYRSSKLIEAWDLTFEALGPRFHKGKRGSEVFESGYDQIKASLQSIVREFESTYHLQLDGLEMTEQSLHADGREHNRNANNKAGEEPPPPLKKVAQLMR